MCVCACVYVCVVAGSLLVLGGEATGVTATGPGLTTLNGCDNIVVSVWDMSHTHTHTQGNMHAKPSTLSFHSGRPLLGSSDRAVDGCARKTACLQ